MSVNPVRVGVPEYVLVAVVLAVGALVGWAVAVGWPVAILPGLMLLVASLAVYGMYRIESTRLETSVWFRVTEKRGECPLGRQVGDRVAIAPGLGAVPQLCDHAQAVLRRASVESADPADLDVHEWCCPVYDHMLVFQREPAAAA